MKQLTILKIVSLCAMLGIWGCGSNKKTTVYSPVQASKAAVAKDSSSDVDKLIAEARQHYFLGERELNLGHLEKAKEEFDASLDVLMKYQGTHAPNSRVESVISELEEKIFQHEMAALKAGDGFSENPLEPALIDDLKNIDTFPSPDQETKQDVENELATTTYDIPVEVNDSVLSFIRIFQNSRRKEFVGGLIRSGRYLDLMKRIYREEGLPEDLVYTALIESSFKPNAYSHARAKGFWQFISGTAKRYDLRMDWWIDERSDFERSTRASARYLKDLHDMFGDWYLALAGYNAGENKILYGLRYSGAQNFWQLARTRYIRQETKNYVPAILAGMIIAKDPKKYGFFEEVESPIQFDVVNIDYTVDLRLVAECTGVTFEEIKMLNPELTRSTTPSYDRDYQLRIPPATRELYLAEIAAIPQDKRITWRKHEVRSGETLTSIAALYRTSASSIASVNAIPATSNVTAGSKLVIPIGRSSASVTYTSRKSTTDSSGERRHYTVRKGDTLARIAGKFGSSVAQLCSWNGFSTGHVLRPGESLIVKIAKFVSTGSSKKIIYEVKQGDTLYRIASAYNIDVDSIKRWNKRAASGGIYPGDRLLIYTK